MIVNLCKFRSPVIISSMVLSSHHVCGPVRSLKRKKVKKTAAFTRRLTTNMGSSELQKVSFAYLLCHVAFLSILSTAADLNDFFEDKELNALREIMSGPVQNKTIVIHFDENLPTHMKESVIAMQEVQHSPHLLTTFFKCPEEVPSLNLEFLHIIVFFYARSDVYKEFYQCWTPRHLLLYGVAPSNPSTILNDDVFDKTEELVLVLTTPDGVRKVFTRLPFENAPVFQGEWELSSFATWDALFIDRFPNFGGHHFHLASWAVTPPSVYTDKKANNFTIVGSNVRMLNVIGDHLNFSFSGMLQPPDRNWGVLLNHSWVGMLGQVYRGEKNFTLNEFYISPDRYKYFDPSIPYRQDGLGLFLAKPETSPPWMNVHQPFSSHVWVAVTACSFVILPFIILQVGFHLHVN